MYKVFINDKCVFFTIDENNFNIDKHCLLVSDPISDDLPALIDKFNGSEHTKLVLITKAPQKLWETFRNEYRLIIAAGGIVLNEQHELLFIFRNGKWDLPKGKVEQGESIEDAAIREVTEECGIDRLNIIRKLPLTYHTYQLHHHAMLKETHWYEMTTASTLPLTPQHEEGISKVKWINKNELKPILGNTYASIRELVEGYLAT